MKYRHEINLVFNEVSILKKKNKELERILDENLFTLIRDLKGQITSVEDQLQRKSSSSGSVEKEQNISQLSSVKKIIQLLYKNQEIRLMLMIWKRN